MPRTSTPPKPIETIQIAKTAKGQAEEGCTILPVPKALGDRVTRIVVHEDGRLHVYAKEVLEGVEFRWGERSSVLAWNSGREPARGEGRLGG